MTSTAEMTTGAAPRSRLRPRWGGGGATGTANALKEAVVGLARRSYPLRYLGLMMICGILMKPSLVDESASLAPLVKALTAAVFLGLVLAYLARGVALSATLTLFILYRLAYLLPTLLNDGDLLNWGYASIAQVSVLMVIELHVGAEEESRRRLLRVLTDLLLLYLMVNAAMILLGISKDAAAGAQFSQPSYLLGIRTRVTDTIFPAIMLAFLYDSTSSRRWGWRSIIAVGTGLLQIAFLHVATALVGTAIAAITYIVVALRPHGRGLLSMRAVTVGGIAITLLVVVARIHLLFTSLIEGTLGKSLTLTGRTDIWDAALPILADSPLFGYGINHEFGRFAPGPDGGLWQAHNQYLQIMHDGGLLAVGLFLALLWVASTRMDHSACDPRARAALTAIYAAMSVMAVSEIYIYNMALFILIPFLASRVTELAGGERAAGTGANERRGAR